MRWPEGGPWEYSRGGVSSPFSRGILPKEVLIVLRAIYSRLPLGGYPVAVVLRVGGILPSGGSDEGPANLSGQDL